MADNNRKYISIINKGGNDIYIKDVEARQSIASKADNTPFGASGTNHSVGLVPDPGASEGNAKYLREDGTWAIPAGGSAALDYTTIDSDVADINASVAANALLKTAQTLTASEKAQVKTNLGIELAGNATGLIIAQSNTNYTTAQVRNIILSTSEPTSSDGSNGDIWIVYEA